LHVHVLVLDHTLQLQFAAPAAGAEPTSNDGVRASVLRAVPNSIASPYTPTVHHADDLGWACKVREHRCNFIVAVWAYCMCALIVRVVQLVGVSSFVVCGDVGASARVIVGYRGNGARRRHEHASAPSTERSSALRSSLSFEDPQSAGMPLCHVSVCAQLARPTLQERRLGWNMPVHRLSM
jgi:hypothetical protein